MARDRRAHQVRAGLGAILGISPVFVVFDLDGTLADCSHRMPMLALDPVPWEDFYLACVNDLPVWPMINTLKAFYAGGAEVEIWSGRSDFVQYQTEQWLSRHGLPSWTLKRMRPHGDHGDDAIMKQAWIYEGGRLPDLVFEDRQRVVDMWRAEGVQCCQVAKGDF